MSKKIKMGINGFGRIGRNVFKLALLNKQLDVVGINDLTDPKTLAHLLKYDSVHGPSKETITYDDQSLYVNDRAIPIFSERHPEALPWKNLDVDVVIESTGIFTTAHGEKGGYKSHLKAGAKKVILTVPAKDPITTIVLGVNDQDIKPTIDTYSNASCTTNCLAPLAKVLHEAFGIEKGLLNTVHAYTNDQHVLDSPHKDLRRSRAAFESIIPTTTGAARAVGLVIPDLKGKLDGMAMRVPIKDGSVIDLTCQLQKEASIEAINSLIKQTASTSLKGIVAYTEDPIVSCDIIGNPHSAIFDSQATLSMGHLIKIVAWYDNEMGYSNRIIDLIQKIL